MADPTLKKFNQAQTFLTIVIDNNPGLDRGQSTYDIEGKRCTIYRCNCSPVQFDYYFMPGLIYLRLHLNQCCRLT